MPTPRFNLPDIDFVDVDAEELESMVVSVFESKIGESLSETDPRRKFIQTIIYLATIIANNIDFTGKQNLLAYAEDNYLDHLGSTKKNVSRLEPSAAETIFRFEINPAENDIIPKGTRFVINEIVFAIKDDTPVTVGMTEVNAPGICEEPGAIGNGFLPGQITDLMDPLPWVVKAYNITKTEGGIDWEDDDAYADRIRQSNSQSSTAGPDDAYVFHTKSANSLIVDVHAYSPSEGVVEVVPLLKDGKLPTEEIISQIYEKLNTKTVRPLTDHLVVKLPEVVYYDINLTYYISKDKASLQESIQQSVDQSVIAYQNWQKAKLGRGIDSSELVSEVKSTGAVRVFADSPSSYIVLKRNQVAIARNVSITYGGIVDE